LCTVSSFHLQFLIIKRIGNTTMMIKKCCPNGLCFFCSWFFSSLYLYPNLLFFKATESPRTPPRELQTSRAKPSIKQQKQQHRSSALWAIREAPVESAGGAPLPSRLKENIQPGIRRPAPAVAAARPRLSLKRPGVPPKKQPAGETSFVPDAVEKPPQGDKVIHLSTVFSF
jgi:hypothetical protein